MPGRRANIDLSFLFGGMQPQANPTFGLTQDEYGNWVDQSGVYAQDIKPGDLPSTQPYATPSVWTRMANPDLADYENQQNWNANLYPMQTQQMLGRQSALQTGANTTEQQIRQQNFQTAYPNGVPGSKLTPAMAAAMGISYQPSAVNQQASAYGAGQGGIVPTDIDTALQTAKAQNISAGQDVQRLNSFGAVGGPSWTGMQPALASRNAVLGSIADYANNVPELGSLARSVGANADIATGQQTALSAPLQGQVQRAAFARDLANKEAMDEQMAKNLHYQNVMLDNQSTLAPLELAAKKQELSLQPWLTTHPEAPGTSILAPTLSQDASGNWHRQAAINPLSLGATMMGKNLGDVYGKAAGVPKVSSNGATPTENSIPTVTRQPVVSIEPTSLDSEAMRRFTNTIQQQQGRPADPVLELNSIQEKLKSGTLNPEQNKFYFDRMQQLKQQLGIR